MSEEWRTIPSFPAYEASSLGRIRRVGHFRWHGPGSILKTPISRCTGYQRVTLIGPFGRTDVNVHVAVCEAFHGPRPNGMQVAHSDGSRTNNKPSNLRWATPSENQKDRINHGTDIRGELVANAILTVEAVREIRRRRAAGERCVDLAPEFGVSQYAISKVCLGKNWRHV